MFENSEDPTIRVDFRISCLCVRISPLVHVTIITNLPSRHHMMHPWIFVGIFSKLPSVIIYRITAAGGMVESYTLCIIRTGILICELSR